MDKVTFLNIFSVLILLAGSACIILAFLNPNRLMDSSKRYSAIKDKQGFIKANKKLYVVFGVVCIITAILSLLEIMNLIFGAMTVSLASAVVNLINSSLIKKYE